MLVLVQESQSEPLSQTLFLTSVILPGMYIVLPSIRLKSNTFLKSQPCPDAFAEPRGAELTAPHHVFSHAHHPESYQVLDMSVVIYGLLCSFLPGDHEILVAIRVSFISFIPCKSPWITGCAQ